MDSSSFLPSTPPLALMSATACSAPAFSWAPKLALEPVIGPAVAILICACAGEAAKISATPRQAAPASSVRFSMSSPQRLIGRAGCAAGPQVMPDCEVREGAGSMPALQIRRPDLRPGQQLGAGSGHGDGAVDQDVAAMGHA